MKISKSCLKQIIKEEIIKELNIKPPRSSNAKAKKSLEDRKVIFKYLLDGEEKVYDNFNIPELLKRSYVRSINEFKEDLWTDMINTTLNPDLYDVLYKANQNLFGENIVDYAYTLAVNKNYEEYKKWISTVDDTVFNDIITEYKYTGVADSAAVFERTSANKRPSIDQDPKIGQTKEQNYSSRPTYISMMQIIKDHFFEKEGIDFPKTQYGQDLKLDTLVEHYIKGRFDLNTQKFLPLSLTFTNVMVDFINLQYKDQVSSSFIKRQFKDQVKEATKKINADKKQSSSEKPEDTKT